MTSILELRNVTKVFGGGMFNRRHTVAVEDVSFSIPAEVPTMTAVAGESGSGKTTLSRLLLGVTRPSSGQVLYKWGRFCQDFTQGAQTVSARCPANLSGSLWSLQSVLQGRPPAVCRGFQVQTGKHRRGRPVFNRGGARNRWPPTG